MTEPGRRPILHLKLGTVVRPLGPAAEPPPAPKPSRPPRPPKAAKPPEPVWKCRPCGSGFDVPATAADEDAVRCPSCNAKLGLARDFRSDPPNIEKLRARPAKR